MASPCHLIWPPARAQRRSPLHGVANGTGHPLLSVASVADAASTAAADAPAPPLAANESALESHSASEEAIGSSVATNKTLPKWFSSTRCTAGVNHTSPGVEETTPLETPSTGSPSPPPLLTTVPTATSESEQSAQTADQETSTVHTTTTKAYAAPPSPTPAAFYVDDA